MSLPALQRRLMDHLIAAIHGIAGALIPVIDTIAKQPTRPWQQRARLADRFNAIIRELLALTARIRPATLSPTPSFPIAPPRPAPQTQADEPAQPRPTKRPPTSRTGPARLLSARQLAQRLAKLLRQLESLAAEAGAALSAQLHHHIASARTIAGCNALPQTSWERAG